MWPFDRRLITKVTKAPASGCLRNQWLEFKGRIGQGLSPLLVCPVHLLIALDDNRGVLDSVGGPRSGPPEEQMGRAADFVAALMRSGNCRIYELESDQLVLEVQLPGVSSERHWFH